MTNEMAMEALNWILHDIAERKNEADAEDKKGDYEQGRAQAYFEVMDMIQSRLAILDVHVDSTTTEAS